MNIIKQDITDEMWDKIQTGNEHRRTFIMGLLKDCASDPDAQLTLRRMVSGFITHKKAAEMLLSRFEHALYETKRAMAKNNVAIPPGSAIMTPPMPLREQDIPDSEIAITLMEAGFCKLIDMVVDIEESQE